MLTFQKLSYIIILASRKGQLSGRKSAQAIKSFGVWLSLARAPGSVSYTHLRAHETGRNLVCRLLLEKKKNKKSKKKKKSNIKKLEI